jgi:alkylated DNA repair dioxygenase AlkB
MKFMRKNGHLFAVTPVFPAGFSYREEFISAAEEDELLSRIAALDFGPFVFRGYTAKRRVVSWGWSYDFEKGQLKEKPPLPEFLMSLRKKAAAFAGVHADEFVQALVTEYASGTPINWHRDAPPFGIIAGISLHAECEFRLRPYPFSAKERKALVKLPVLPRSIYIMRDAVRERYQHSIAPVKTKRYSVTFRTLRTS